MSRRIADAVKKQCSDVQSCKGSCDRRFQRYRETSRVGIRGDGCGREQTVGIELAQGKGQKVREEGVMY